MNLHVAVADQQVLVYAYWRLLYDLLYDRVGDVPKTPTEDELAKAREIVNMTWPQARQFLVCECGHVLADHDEKGCMYIVCRNICPVNDKLNP